MNPTLEITWYGTDIEANADGLDQTRSNGPGFGTTNSRVHHTIIHVEWSPKLSIVL